MIKECKFAGDCLEGIGIPDKGTVTYDTELKPMVFDIVLCDSVYGGSIGMLMKECIQTGDRLVVRTHYSDPEKDRITCTPGCFGVVTEVRDDNGDIVYKRYQPEDRSYILHRANSFVQDAITKTRYRHDAAHRNGEKWEIVHRLYQRMDILYYLLQLVRKEMKSR